LSLLDSHRHPERSPPQRTESKDPQLLFSEIQTTKPQKATAAPCGAAQFNHTDLDEF
jgi:hypothetical protein